ncbi:hypothetical protein BsWGS_14231 [Bradybaena similaris]
MKLQSRVITVLFMWQLYISEQYTPPKIVDPEKRRVLKYRTLNRIYLNCTATGDPQPTYRWTMNGTTVQSAAAMIVNSETGVLTIADYQREDQGSYRCFATNTFEAWTVTCIAPIIEMKETRLENFGERYENETYFVKEFDYLQLLCDDSQKSVAPELGYAWLNRKRDVLDSRMHRLFIDQRGDLHFTYLVPSDAEVDAYYCGIYMYVGISKHTSVGTKRFLRVSSQTPKVIAPQLRYSNSGVKAVISSTAAVECMFSGYDLVSPHLPTITWVDAAGKAYQVGDKYNISEDGRRLFIMNVQLEDEKNYMCRGRNSGGETSGSVFLNVTSGPILPSGMPADQTVAPGSDASFQCKPKPLPGETDAVQVVWYINGKKVQNGYDQNTYKFSPDRKTLTIKNLKTDKEIRCVQCEVTNDVDTAMGNAYLRVDVNAATSKDSADDSLQTLLIALTSIAILLVVGVIALCTWRAFNNKPEPVVVPQPEETVVETKEEPEEDAESDAVEETEEVENISIVESAVDEDDAGTNVS